MGKLITICMLIWIRTKSNIYINFLLSAKSTLARGKQIHLGFVDYPICYFLQNI